MALDKIEKLIEKYFEGETSIAEEKELRDYFLSSNVAQHLEQYKTVFGYFSQAKQEQFKVNIPLLPNSRNKKQKRVVWLSIAATVTVLLGAGILTYQSYITPETENLGVVNDPEVAFRETKKALDMISEHVNTGITGMGYLNEYQQSKNKIFKK